MKNVLATCVIGFMLSACGSEFDTTLDEELLAQEMLREMFQGGLEKAEYKDKEAGKLKEKSKGFVSVDDLSDEDDDDDMPDDDGCTSSSGATGTTWLGACWGDESCICHCTTAGGMCGDVCTACN